MIGILKEEIRSLPCISIWCVRLESGLTFAPHLKLATKPVAASGELEHSTMVVSVGIWGVGFVLWHLELWPSSAQWNPAWLSSWTWQTRRVFCVPEPESNFGQSESDPNCRHLTPIWILIFRKSWGKTMGYTGWREFDPIRNPPDPDLLNPNPIRIVIRIIQVNLNFPNPCPKIWIEFRCSDQVHFARSNLYWTQTRSE